MSTTTLVKTEPQTAKGPHTPAFVRQISTRLPVLVEERAELQTTIDKHNIFWGLWNNLPEHQFEIYQRRIAELDGEIKGLSRYDKAVKLGYQPYTPPADWFVGLYDRKDWLASGDNRVRVSLTFNAPIPDFALEKLNKARGTGLFATYLLAAPDRSLFIETPLRQVASRPAPLYVDPVLIGYVRTKDRTSIRSTVDLDLGREVAPGIITDGAVGFLIAYWDLEKDLAFMQSR